jgi:hypothetical protein
MSGYFDIMYFGTLFLTYTLEFEHSRWGEEEHLSWKVKGPD